MQPGKVRDKKKQLIKLKKRIKRKHHSLVKNTYHAEQNLAKRFKPITEPLVNMMNIKTEHNKERDEDFKFKKLMNDTPTQKLTIHNDEYGSERRKSNFALSTSHTGDNHEGNNDPSIDTNETSPVSSLRDGDKGTALNTSSDSSNSYIMNENETTPPRVIDTIEQMVTTPQGRYMAPIYLKNVDHDFMRREGELSMEYIAGLMSDAHNIFDHTYGPKFYGDKLKLGSALIVFDNDNIELHKEDRIHENDDSPEDLVMKIEEPTRGVYELIFKKDPKDFSPDDSEKYKRMLSFTNAHRVDSQEESNIRTNRGKKYVSIIKALFPPKRETGKKKTGSGLAYNGKNPDTKNIIKAGLNMKLNSDKNVQFLYYDDPNELCDRLKYLVSSYNAGNTGLINEIRSIIEEMFEKGLIDTTNISI